MADQAISFIPINATVTVDALVVSVPAFLNVMHDCSFQQSLSYASNIIRIESRASLQHFTLYHHGFPWLRGLGRDSR
jgi:hypothetical protein